MLRSGTVGPLASPEWQFLCLGAINEPTEALAHSYEFAGRLGFWQKWTATPGSHNMGYVMRANSSVLVLRLVWQTSLATPPLTAAQPVRAGPVLPAVPNSITRREKWQTSR